MGGLFFFLLPLRNEMQYKQGFLLCVHLATYAYSTRWTKTCLANSCMIRGRSPDNVGISYAEHDIVLISLCGEAFQASGYKRVLVLIRLLSAHNNRGRSSTKMVVSFRVYKKSSPNGNKENWINFRSNLRINSTLD